MPVLQRLTSTDNWRDMFKIPCRLGAALAEENQGRNDWRTVLALAKMGG